MKKTRIISCAVIAAIFLTVMAVAVSANETLELKDLPIDQQNEIVQQKLNESDSVEESLSIDYSNKETIFESMGFGDQDRRERLPSQTRKCRDDEITQDYLYEHMLNTMDYYESLQGNFTLENVHSNVNYTVFYSVDGENHHSFERFIDNGGTLLPYNADNDMGGLSREIISYFNGDVCTVAEILKNPYSRTAEYEKEIIDSYHVDVEAKENYDFVSLIKATSRVTVDQEGIDTFYYRENLDGLGYSRESIDPQELAMGYLRDFETWSICGQEYLCGRSCSIIKGSLSGLYSEKLHTSNFTLWVDNETGVLIQLEGYDANGELSEKLMTNEIKVNIPVSDGDIQKLFDEA